MDVESCSSAAVDSSGASPVGMPEKLSALIWQDVSSFHQEWWPPPGWLLRPSPRKGNPQQARPHAGNGKEPHTHAGNGEGPHTHAVNGKEPHTHFGNGEAPPTHAVNSKDPPPHFGTGQIPAIYSGNGNEPPPHFGTGKAPPGDFENCQSLRHGCLDVGSFVGSKIENSLAPAGVASSSPACKEFLGADSSSCNGRWRLLPAFFSFCSPSSVWARFVGVALSKYESFLCWSAFQNWRVKVLANSLSAMGRPVDLVLTECPAGLGHGAGYSPHLHVVWICRRPLLSPFAFRRLLIHELVHAFDFARANLHPDDCTHVACSEIRAWNLSGQCAMIHAKQILNRNDCRDLDELRRKLLLDKEAAATRKEPANQAENPRIEEAAPAFWGKEKEEGEARMRTGNATDAGGFEAAERGSEKGGEEYSGLEGGAVLCKGLRETLGASPAEEIVRESPAPVGQLASDRDRCVALGALASLRQHPRCTQAGIAEKSVAAVFTRCLRDVWPFMGQPERDSRWRPSRLYANPDTRKTAGA
eukprot:GHVT01047718.1.p1 GENE.GHVT01047718.1~~GHVT01047718.1.p1  ORF type:complete len:529 (-),score=103.39 GHVT01047718.1:179-1765(-)